VPDVQEVFAEVIHLKGADGYEIDATHLIAKAMLWKEGDKARQQKIEPLNNIVLPKLAADPQARSGCRGNKKYWYGYTAIRTRQRRYAVRSD
jgi:hypothetical protein